MLLAGDNLYYNNRAAGNKVHDYEWFVTYEK
jgi:hypothetical protein